MDGGWVEVQEERIPDPDNCQITVCIGFVARAWKAPGFPLLSATGENMSHPPLGNEFPELEVTTPETCTAASGWGAQGIRCPSDSCSSC